IPLLEREGVRRGCGIDRLLAAQTQAALGGERGMLGIAVERHADGMVKPNSARIVSAPIRPCRVVDGERERISRFSFEHCAKLVLIILLGLDFLVLAAIARFGDELWPSRFVKIVEIVDSFSFPRFRLPFALDVAAALLKKLLD